MLKNATGNEALPAAPAVIWSDDFSDTTNWMMSNTSSPSQDWVIGTAPLPIIGVLNSTSGGNFAGFDSNTPGNGSTQNGVIETVNPVDCSGYPNVSLSFEQAYARFMDSVYVEISNDGNNWTVFQINTNVPINQLTPNPDQYILDISTVAGNEDTVLIRFRFVGGWDYAWAVDDVTLISPHNNDLEITSGFFNYDTFIDTTQSLYYTRIPEKHARIDTLLFAAAVTNQGLAAQPNTVLNVNVTGTATFNGTSGTINLAPGSSDSLKITGSPFTPYDKGAYNVGFSLSSDSTEQNPNNNSWDFDFNVTDTVYARDNGNFTGLGAWFGPNVKWQGGNMFSINKTDTATSLSFLFHGTTTPNAEVNFHIYDNTLTAPIVSVSSYLISALELGSWITIPIPATTLTPGKYVVAFESVNVNEYVVIGTGNGNPKAPPLTSYTDKDANGIWAYTNFIPFIRLNVKGDSCTAYSATINITNPSCGASDGDIAVTPSGGAAPYAYIWDANAGSQTDSTATGLAAGNYTVTISDSKGCIEVFNVILNNINGPTVSDTVTDVLCYDDCDGEATATPSGATPPYAYLWSDPGFQTDSTATGLCAGSYFITVSDFLNCATVHNLVLNEPPLLSVTISNTPDSAGAGIGTATANPAGGIPLYSYLWNDPNSQTDQTASGLFNGTYNVVVTDSNGCTATTSVTLIGMAEPVSHISMTVFPNPSDGKFTLRLSNASKGDYQLYISNVMGQQVYRERITFTGNINKQIDISHLHKGIYFLIISLPAPRFRQADFATDATVRKLIIR